MLAAEISGRPRDRGRVVVCELGDGRKLGRSFDGQGSGSALLPCRCLLQEWSGLVLREIGRGSFLGDLNRSDRLWLAWLLVLKASVELKPKRPAKGR
jgi:hypothetical protein